MSLLHPSTPIHTSGTTTTSRSELLPLNTYRSRAAEEMQPYILGPMPAREFLSSFLPSDSKEVPLAFKEGMFLDLVNSKPETAIEGPPDNTPPIKPDCTVYDIACGPSAEADPARAEFFVKCKGSHSNDPFAKTLQAAMDGENIFMKHHNAGNTTGQIVNYIAAQMGCQYRTHTFLVLVVKDYARLTRWDCGGVIVTD
ncbi:hypothetical protein EDB83DRAFT_2326024 [Lactarius deliciosus]|nr:hypothetical protein EDB83DRAFT_2326024 [Lactarius deliciosus]